MAAPERRRAEVIHPFGGPVVFRTCDMEDGIATTAAREDVDLVRRTLLGFDAGEAGLLRIYRPGPTAAFSPRDTTLNRYADAVDAMRAHGFEAVERRAGGQLAIYDDNAIVIDLVAPHDDPREHVIERFRRFSGAIASTLVSFGVDARVGPVDGEYCPGDYSVNGEGRIKLAGVAQRIARRGYHIGAVVSVTASGAARDAVEHAYRILNLPFDPQSFGAMADLAPDICFARFSLALRTAIARMPIEVQVTDFNPCPSGGLRACRPD